MVTVITCLKEQGQELFKRKKKKGKKKKIRLVFYPYIYFFGPHSLRLLVRLIAA